MAKKRSHVEIENIDNVDGPMSSTSIHGAVVTLSPVKKGRKAMFFDGLLADETSQIRLVGFQGMQQQKLNDYHQKNIAVELQNCEVKPARQGEGYEVMMDETGIRKFITLITFELSENGFFFYCIFHAVPADTSCWTPKGARRQSRENGQTDRQTHRT